MKSTVKYSAILAIVAVGAVILGLGYFLSNVLAILTGLAFIISAVSFAYTTSTKMVQTRVVTSHLNGLTLALDRILKESGYEGKTCFLPPQLMGEQPVQMIGNKSIIPTGLNLESTFELEAGVDFFSINLEELEELLVKVLVDKLEIASEVRFSGEKEVISIQLKGFVFYEFYSFLQQSNLQYLSVLSPVVSSLACALAKATRKTVWVDEFTLKKQDLKIKFRYI